MNSKQLKKNFMTPDCTDSNPIEVLSHMPYFSPYIPSITSQIPQTNKTTIFEKAKLLASLHNGESLSATYSICKGKNALKFKCENSHTFFIGVNQIEMIPMTILEGSVKTAAISDDCWCYKCNKFFETCKEIAAQVGV